MGIIRFEPEGEALLTQGAFRSHRLLGIGPGLAPDSFGKDLPGDLAAVRGQDAFPTCRAIAAREGLLVGITLVASAQVAPDLVRRLENAGKTIVILFAGAGQGYLSIAGLFDEHKAVCVLSSRPFCDRLV